MADPVSPVATQAAPVAVPARRIALWAVATVVVSGIGLAIPLKIYPLKEKKAEAEAIPPRVHVQRPPQFGDQQRGLVAMPPGKAPLPEKMGPDQTTPQSTPAAKPAEAIAEGIGHWP